MKFNNLSWHDAIIKNIIIDRNNPGKNDSIKIEIVWNDGQCNILSFEDVYWADLDMNFGVICEESIYRAHAEGKENEEVKSLYKRWRGLINNIDLYFYEIETNSTGSRIRIIAQRFLMEG